MIFGRETIATTSIKNPLGCSGGFAASATGW